MKRTDVGTLLNSIGKKTFIKYYEAFKDMDISHQEMIDRLALDPQKFTFTSMGNKTSSARRIFREGLEVEALQIILGSKADIGTVEKARMLLDKELKNKDMNVKEFERVPCKTLVKNQPTSTEINSRILETIEKLRKLPSNEAISEQIKLLESLL